MKVPAGLLYYMQSEEVIRIPIFRNELRGLLIQRNEIAAHTVCREAVEVSPATYNSPDGGPETMPAFPKRIQLPPSIDDEWACSRCYNVDACMLYRKVQSNLPLSARS